MDMLTLSRVFLALVSSPGISSVRTGLGQSQEASELHLGLTQCDRGPNTWAVSCCFPQTISRKLDQKVEKARLELASTVEGSVCSASCS